MRAIVTGGAGFIGSHLVDRLKADGWVVRVVDDYSTWTTKPDFPHASVNMVGGFQGVDVVFHLASKVGPVGVLRFAGDMAKEIIDDAHTVSTWGGILVYVSTSEVYGANGLGADEETPRVIAAGHSARMEYAAGKLAAETMLLNRPGDVRIVRPFNVAGPRQRVDGGFVLPRFIAQALAGEPLTVYQPGTQRRAFTHVLDIVDGLMAVAERGKSHEDYNLGNPANECSIRQLAEEVVEATDSLSDIVVVDPRDLHGPGFHEAPDKVPDASKALHQLGWTPTRDRRRVILDSIPVRA